MDTLRFDWPTYYGLIERLALLIDDDGYAFDTIVCLARGGMRAGDVLSRLFDRPLGVLFTSAYRQEGGRVQGDLIMGGQIGSALPLPGRQVLLVDDLVDTGVTFNAVREALPGLIPTLSTVKTAALWVKAHATYVPDYCVERLAGDPWIVQPFEVYDDCGIEGLRQLRAHAPGSGT